MVTTDKAAIITTPLKNTHVLITGGAGMIGSTIARQVMQQGGHVTVLDAMSPDYGANHFNLDLDSDSVTFVQGDIRDLDLIKRLVDGTDYIFSLAAQVSYVDSNVDPFLDIDINCKGHITLLEACREVNREAKLVFASSRFVYGRLEYNPVDENHPFNCLSIYGIHKLAGEKYYRFYYERYGINSVSLRITNPYGPRQQMRHSKYGIVNWFVRQALDKQPLTIYGDGNQKRDYIFVEDLADGMISAALSPETNGSVYNLGSGTATAFVDMARTIAEIIPGTEIVFLEWPVDRYFVETGDCVISVDKLNSVTSWRPKHSLYEGLVKTVEYYRAFRSHYW